MTKDAIEIRQIRDFLKGLKIDSMADGKALLTHMLGIGVLRTPTFNDLLLYLNREPEKWAAGWGWPDLFNDLLSTKYGVKAKHDPRTRKTLFDIYLPPADKLLQAADEEESE